MMILMLQQQVQPLRHVVVPIKQSRWSVSRRNVWFQPQQQQEQQQQNGIFGRRHRFVTTTNRSNSSSHTTTPETQEVQDHQQDHYYPAIIVGGGPTGLLLSNLLSQSGSISHLVLEAKSLQDSFQHPQAHFLNTRTMEVLRTNLPRVYQRARQLMPPVSEYESFLFGYNISSNNPLARVVHPVRYPLQINRDSNGILIEQHHSIHNNNNHDEDPVLLERNSLSPCTVGHLAQHSFSRLLYEEAVIAAANNNHKTRLQFGTRVNRVERDPNDPSGRRIRVIASVPVAATNDDDGGGRTATTTTSTTTEVVWTTDVCIAADGANSTLRTAQKLGNYKEQYLINVHVKLTPQQQHRFSSTSKNSFMLCTALNEHVVSMIVSHGHGEYVLQIPYFPPYQDPNTDFTLPKLNGILSHGIFGFPISPEQILSIRPWTMTSWIASRYYDSSHGLIWVGDAAHAFPPAGGFGMNTGLQDAHNLAWKISSLFQQQQYNNNNDVHDDDYQFVQRRNFWFDSYEKERQPVATENAALSVRNYNRVLAVMNECYLNYKHPQLLQGTLDAMAPVLSLSSRRAMFKSFLQMALKPLAWLDDAHVVAAGGSSTSESSWYRNHIQSNLQRVLKDGGGLPLLFPRFELGFGYRHHNNHPHHHDGGDNNIHGKQKEKHQGGGISSSSDTWGDETLATIRVGYRLPHASIVPIVDDRKQDKQESSLSSYDWSTIDLPSVRLAQRVIGGATSGDGGGHSGACSWVILLVVVGTSSSSSSSGGSGAPSSQDFEFWEEMRETLETKTRLSAHMVYLVPSRPVVVDDDAVCGSPLEGLKWHHLFVLKHPSSSSRAFGLTQPGVALIRPDGHVAAWLEGLEASNENDNHNSNDKNQIKARLMEAISSFCPC